MKKLIIGILLASSLTSAAFAADYYRDSGQDDYHYVNQYEARGRAEGHYWENHGRNEGQYWQAHNYHHQHYYQNDEHNHYFD